METMKKITVSASGRYDVRIGHGLLPEAGSRIKEAVGVRRTVILSDDRVYPLWGHVLEESLHTAGIPFSVCLIKNGEASKTLTVYGDILRYLAREQFPREGVILALGGGVVGDMAGFCAATYCRGVAYVSLPTTLLAAVDSSVGGKTAIDLPEGKNLVGAFYQPKLVLCDPDCFSTLDDRERACGMAEVIKYGVLGDGAFFEALEAGTMPLDEIVSRCVSMKRDMVEQDEFDNGVRRLLNFGHTFGHAYETMSGYALTHGEAVACGMMTASRLAETMGIAGESVSERLGTLLSRNHLPTDYPADSAALIDHIRNDKKANADGVTLILPQKIGVCRTVTMTFGELSAALTKIQL